MATPTYLITHAHTAQDRDHDSRKWVLSEDGRRQVVHLAAEAFWSEVTQVIVSSEAKTLLTVGPITRARALPVTVDARFDELHRPGWVDDYSAHVAATFRFPERSIGGWEPASLTLARFLSGAEVACRRFHNETLALVGHGLSLSLYMAFAGGRDSPDLDEWQRLGFAAVANVDLERHKIIQPFRNISGGPARR